MTRHLVIMAAGTGGHIVPGLAMASGGRWPYVLRACKQR